MLPEEGKSIFVVLERADENPDTLALLHNILKAVDAAYKIKTQKIVVGSQVSTLAYPLVQNKHPKKILVFGIGLKNLGLHLDIPKYAPTTINEASLLSADNLGLIDTDKSLKIQLWKALQAMFSVVKK